MSVKLYSVFVYGTLMSPDVIKMVIGRIPTRYGGVLNDYKKVGLNIIEAPGEIVEGTYFEVTNEELAMLDRYESVATGLYKRIKVDIQGEPCIAYQKVNPDVRINLES